MSFIVGIDIGGTFTDAFAQDSEGNLYSAKSPSTPPNFEHGLINVVKELANRAGFSVEDLLGQTEYICHGTTAALNALVTGDVAKVGFLTTMGHADSIMIMNLEGRYAGKSADYIKQFSRTDKPLPLVPRSQIREVLERVDYKGAVIVPLQEGQLRRDIQALVAEGVEAFAVSLLWSFANPEHERRVREIIREYAPDAYVGLSSELSPRIREYARNVTTIMSTQVAPKLRGYLDPLHDSLSDLGFQGTLMVMQGSGGSVKAEEAPDRAITTIGSVLTGGLVGCQKLGEQLGHRNIISTDIGGTTFLVGMVVDGEPVKSPTTILNQYTISTPTAKVSTIGSGGGAIAWVDSAGNLRVGPRSAGAVPGPACYGAGGTEPTVTDADLVLGLLNGDNFLGGKKKLDKSLAEAAIEEKIAMPLGLSMEEAAIAIYGIQNAQAADLVRSVVVNSGYDPRDFVVYAFGGAGPLHCANYSKDIQAKAVVAPLGSTASTFSAYGLAASDVVLSEEISRPMPYPVDPGPLEMIYQELETRVMERMTSQSLPFSKIRIDREVDVRYSMQMSEVSTPVLPGPLDEGAIEKISENFDSLYAALYGEGTGFKEAGIQLITFRVFATGEMPFNAELPTLTPAVGEAVPYTSRRAYLSDEAGWLETPVYKGGDLAPGNRFSGPAIVEAETTTLVVPQGFEAEVDHLANVVLTQEPELQQELDQITLEHETVGAGSASATLSQNGGMTS